METPEIKYELLKEPFEDSDIQWRVITAKKGARGIFAIVAPYVDSRAIMERLDSIVGATNWQTHYTETAKGFICELTIDGITKSDGAECTDIEPTKGGISDALKRAGVPWGIGRYLYRLSTPMYGIISDNGIYSASLKDKTKFKWSPPKLPSWATPSTKKKETPEKTKEGITDAHNEAVDNATKILTTDSTEAEKLVQRISTLGNVYEARNWRTKHLEEVESLMQPDRNTVALAFKAKLAELEKESN